MSGSRADPQVCGAAPRCAGLTARETAISAHFTLACALHARARVRSPTLRAVLLSCVLPLAVIAAMSSSPRIALGSGGADVCEEPAECENGAPDGVCGAAETEYCPDCCTPCQQPHSCWAAQPDGVCYGENKVYCPDCCGQGGAGGTTSGTASPGATSAGGGAANASGDLPASSSESGSCAVAAGADSGRRTNTALSCVLLLLVAGRRRPARRRAQARAASLAALGLVGCGLLAACADEVAVGDPAGGSSSGAGGDADEADGGSSSGAGIDSHECGGCGGAPNGNYCHQPGSGPCGDPCAQSCTADSDCVFMDGVCVLCGASSVCAPKCASNADCETGEGCSPESRCVSLPCAADEDCPANFECSPDPGGAQQCTRRSCLSDGDCAGLCVNAICYEQGPSCRIC